VDRRRFIEACVGLAGYPLLGLKTASAEAATTRAVDIKIDGRKPRRRIPDDFIGLGYEISSVAIAGLLSDKNRANVELVRRLGRNGVIRVGGITSDSSSFAADAVASPAPKATRINIATLRELGGFLDATGWKLIWGLNLGDRNVENAVEEAVAVAAAVNDKLLAFEIGNEPDGFAGQEFGAHRPTSYSYDDYLKEYREYKAAIRVRLPGAPFAGPDASWDTNWVTRFAADEGGDLKLLTRHYYRAGANNPYLDRLFEASHISPQQRADYEARRKNNKIDLLLQKDPSVGPMLQELGAASAAAHAPYRICEANSFYGGGQPGASDTFVAALWVLDFMWTLAQGGCVGVNMETGVNHLDFVSYYSPIRNGPSAAVSVAAEYYGMLAFAQAAQGECLAPDYDSADLNLTAYAALASDGHLSVTVINKDPHGDADVTITADESFRRAVVLRLAGYALDSADGVTLGGAVVAADGSWSPVQVEAPVVTAGKCKIRMPAATAAVVQLTA
jgi:hypothetical protein